MYTAIIANIKALCYLYVMYPDVIEKEENREKRIDCFLEHKDQKTNKRLSNYSI